MKPNTRRYQILEGLWESDYPLTARELADELDERGHSNRRSLSAAVSKLHEEGYVLRRGEGGSQDPYEYWLSTKGRNVLDDGEDEETGLGALFDMDPEAFDEEDTDPSGSIDSDVPAHVWDDLQTLENRISELERLLATGEAGVPVTLPIADKDADLDHATVIENLPNKYKIRPYLRALFGIPDEDEQEDMTATEERAAENDDVGIVEK